MNFGFEITLYDNPFKDLYDKIYTIGYYSGFYTSQKDNIWANGDHYEICQKMKKIVKIYVSTPFLDLSKTITRWRRK